MNTIRHCVFLLMSFVFYSCSVRDGNDNAVVLINTSAGDFKVELYNETPIHRDNFLKLVNSGLYEGVSFHRVINGFMVQTGDLMTKPGNTLTEKDSVNAYTIPSEFNRKYYHKKGALAAARMGSEVNPYMRSSGTQFYIVQGKKLTDEEIPSAEYEVNNRIKQAFFLRFITEISDSLSNSGASLPAAAIQEQASLRLYDWIDRSGEYKMTDEMKNTYKTIGGTPRLDGTYTVFGEVIEGLETIDRIAEAKTDASDRPFDDIRILKMKIIKKLKK